MTKTARLSELDALIDDLTVDAYGDEQQPGFSSAPTKPYRAASPRRLVGVEVEAGVVDAGPDARIGLTARVRRDAKRTTWRSPTSPSTPTASWDGSSPRTGAGRAARRSAA